MALPPAFLDELRARTPLSALVGRRVKLSKSGRNWRGCCPFHGEKSPSFYVYDDHFHCFGCGVHGDAISFVMQSAGASFPEAVEQLAGEAGLEVPKPSPRAVEAERQRLDLHGVLEAAQASFVRRLHERDGEAGLAYLRGRGLTDATIARFGLGWSGEGRGALIAELGRAGIEPQQMLDAGLLRETDDGGPAREAYWGRVTFPIRDRRGRLVSFGGRTLGDGKPKYINGAETALYSKKRTLYALDLARAGVRENNPLVVAEGYMDVIALHQAGFAGAVAPLGTALTEEQLEELWRLAPTPTLCFDGDGAGARAAARVAELCLPMLTPERSLRFASLPGGEDPDTLIRSGGPRAFRAVLDAARPLSDALYEFIAEQGVGGSPEQRAAMRARLVAAAGRIADKGLAGEYRSTLLNRYYESKQRPGQKGQPRRAAPRPVRTGMAESVQAERARCLVAILLRHPMLLQSVEEDFESLVLPPGLARLRDEMLRVFDGHALDSTELLAHLSASGLADEAAEVLSDRKMPLPAGARPDTMMADAYSDWQHIIGLIREDTLRNEVAAAEQDFKAMPTIENQTRLIARITALNDLKAAQSED